MTLLDEADSEFGKLQVFRVDDDHRDRSFAGATVLMRAHTPDAVLSEYRPGVATTGGVFDLFAMLPPLVAHQPPAYPSAPRARRGHVRAGYAQFYPDDRRRMVGWELDPVIVDVARRHFGLGELEASGRLIARAGDGFEEIRRASREGRLLAGIIVDVFDEKSRVLPELTRAETWLDVARALAPGGRVVANLSTGRGRGADLDGGGGGAVRGDDVWERESDAVAIGRHGHLQRGGHHGSAADGMESTGGAAVAASEIRGGVVRGGRRRRERREGGSWEGRRRRARFVGV